MNDRLKTIVDLEKYPIQDLNSSQIKELIKKCKNDLDNFSCATIPNFILPKSLKIMNIELEKQISEVYMSKKKINASFFLDPSLYFSLSRKNVHFFFVEKIQRFQFF